MATLTHAPTATTTAFAEMTAPHGQQWNQPSRQEVRTNLDRVNVSDLERWISLLAGSGLAAYGASRRDLAGLGLALVGAGVAYRGLTGHCHIYQLLGVNTAAPHSSQASIPAGGGVKVEKSTTVRRPRAELYRFWRDFSNLPRVMKNLESVTVTGPNRSHWVAKGPLGVRVEWDAEIINERPNELIAWRSVEGSTVDTAGSVHFEETLGGDTEVQVVLKYDPPAGKVGATVASFLGANPEAEIEEDLRKFKESMEQRSPSKGKR